MLNGHYVSVSEVPHKKIGQIESPSFDENKRGVRGMVSIPLTYIQLPRLRGIKEVSAGIFADEEYSPGKWNGEDFVGISKNVKPDHLALVSEGQGACSWSDGCGIRANLDPATVRVYREALNELLRQANIPRDKGVLLPAGYEREQLMTETELRELQDRADERGVLLPFSEMNQLPNGKGLGRDH
jgi:hypothetical protein